MSKKIVNHLLRPNSYSHIMFDMHNLFYRAYYSIKHKFKNSEVYKESIKLSLKMIKNYQTDFLEDGGLSWFCFDNHDSKINIRCELSEEYKKNRKKESDAFYKSVEMLKNILLSFDESYKVVYIQELEADDLILPLLNNVTSSNEKIILISNDMDWARCIDYNNQIVHWSYTKKVKKVQTVNVYDSGVFEKDYGFKPSVNKICLYKTISGDSSDGIKPGIPYLKEEIKVQICNDFEDLFEFLTEYYSYHLLSDRMWEVIRDNENTLRKNWQLVSFINLEKFGTHIKNHVYNGKFSYKMLQSFFVYINMPLSFYNRLQQQVSLKDNNRKQALFIPEKRKAK